MQLNVRAALRRRLLAAAAAVAVDVTINLPDAASASKAKAALTPDVINTAVKATGLPPATITSQPALSGAARQHRSLAAAAAAALVATLAAAAM